MSIKSGISAQPQLLASALSVEPSNETPADDPDSISRRLDWFQKNIDLLHEMDGHQAVVYYHLQDEIAPPSRFVTLITLALILAAIIAFLVFITHFTRPRDQWFVSITPRPTPSSVHRICTTLSN